MTSDRKQPDKEPQDSERARFARFAKKLVNVPKKEIDEKQREWESRPGRPSRSPSKRRET